MKPVSGQTAVAALIVTASTYITYALGLVVSALIARSIGPDKFGQYSYTVMLVGVLSILANNGLTTSGIRFISQCSGSGAKEEANNVHGWLRRAQLISLVVVALLFISSVPWVKPRAWEESTAIFSAIVLVCLFSKGIFLFDVSIAKGYMQFKVEAMINVIVSVATAIVVVVMFVLQFNLLSYLLLFVISSIAYWAISEIMLRRLKIVSQNGPIETNLMKSLRSHLGWTMLLTFVGAFGSNFTEVYFLDMFTDPTKVGYFAIAVALTRGGVEVLSSGLTTVLMPVMANAYGAGGNDRVGMILPQSVRYFNFLGLFIAGLGIFLAKPVVILLYGDPYQPVIDILRVLMFVGGLTLSTGAFGALLSITDHQRTRAALTVFVVLVNIIAAITLIPKFGLTGALAAQVISRLLGLVISVVAAKMIMTLKIDLKQLLRLIISAAISIFLATLIYQVLPSMIADLVAALVFAASYFWLSIKLNIWQREDVKIIISIANRLPSSFQSLNNILRAWERKLESTES